MTHCPVCGRCVAQAVGSDEAICSSGNCPAWGLVAVYDHDQRQWLPVDDDGYALDGREVG